MRDSLQAEITAYLDSHGPATTKEIAAGIHARRQAVAEALLAGMFQRAERPQGAHPRRQYWVAVGNASRSVPRAARGKGRAALMLAALSDGRKHSRADIYRAAGRYFLTNNAASQLRKQGHLVRHAVEDGLHVYWLEHPATAALPARVVSISGRPQSQEVAA